MGLLGPFLFARYPALGDPALRETPHPPTLRRINIRPVDYAERCRTILLHERTLHCVTLLLVHHDRPAYAGHSPVPPTLRSAATATALLATLVLLLLIACYGPPLGCQCQQPVTTVAPCLVHSLSFMHPLRALINYDPIGRRRRSTLGMSSGTPPRTSTSLS